MTVRPVLPLLVCAALMALCAVAMGAPSNAITTVAGNGSNGAAGDAGLATLAQLNDPNDVWPTADGGFLIADTSNQKVREVSPGGAITTIAGNGSKGSTGDGGPATAAQLDDPTSARPTADGGVLIAERGGHRIRKVAANGTITTVAGTGVAGFAGDGGAAVAAQLRDPQVATPTTDGGFLIADTANHRVRRVSAGGTITTVAGNGSAAFSGDAGPATAATLQAPLDVVALADGGYVIADTLNDRVRRVSAAGTITTIAGTGLGGYAGDGGPATAATLGEPAAVAVAPDGSILVADTRNERIRRIAPDGSISTLAGNGTGGYAGDTAAATAAELNVPLGVSARPNGSVLIADEKNHRIRAVDAGLVAPAGDGGGGGGGGTTTPTTSADGSTDAPKNTPPAADPLTPPGLGTLPDAGPTTPRATPPVPEPQLGKTVVAGGEAGEIRIRKPGTPTFVTLARDAAIPPGAVVDATRGTVRIVTALPGGGEQAGSFRGGQFTVRQVGATGMTELVLKGGDFGRCRAQQRRTTARAAGKRAVRKLWGRDDHGRFRTHGRHSAATVRGTEWLVEDRCDGTLTRVTKGAVDVRPHRGGKTVRVRAGRSHLVPARRSR